MAITMTHAEIHHTLNLLLTAANLPVEYKNRELLEDPYEAYRTFSHSIYLNFSHGWGTRVDLTVEFDYMSKETTFKRCTLGTSGTIRSLEESKKFADVLTRTIALAEQIEAAFAGIEVVLDPSLKARVEQEEAERAQKAREAAAAYKAKVEVEAKAKKDAAVAKRKATIAAKKALQK